MRSLLLTRVFVGQRAEGFAVNLGQIFDLVNMGVSALGVTPTGNQADLTGPADEGKNPPVDSAHGPTLNLARTGCDPAGFPNGRRPGDDTVDLALRVAMGFLLDQDHAPIRGAPLVDGAAVDASMFQSAFPYLNTPIAGSP